MKRLFLAITTIFAFAALAGCKNEVNDNYVESLVPNIEAIDAWPGNLDNPELAVEQNTQRYTTYIVFDDSGSMRNDMEGARQALVQAVKTLPEHDRLGIAALNAGEKLAITSVAEAQREIETIAEQLRANGVTPLGASIEAARNRLTMDAQRQSGSGLYRMLIITDGVASDHNKMLEEIRTTLNTTPIEMVTVGLKLRSGHALNLPGHTVYVDVDNTDALSEALQKIVAERSTFEPITSFD